MASVPAMTDLSFDKININSNLQNVWTIPPQHSTIAAADSQQTDPIDTSNLADQELVQTIMSVENIPPRCLLNFIYLSATMWTESETLEGSIYTVFSHDIHASNFAAQSELEFPCKTSGFHLS